MDCLSNCRINLVIYKAHSRVRELAGGVMLYGIGQWWLFLLMLIGFYLCAEVGFRFGRRGHQQFNKDSLTHVSTIEGALLGLLALLLGFAFSMAMGRFDDRRAVVLGEVNDLATTDLRAKLLPEPHQTQSHKLLGQYVASRLEYLRAGSDRDLINRSLKETTELQKLLWNEAVNAARLDSDEVRTGYFIESLNSLIDDHTRRVAAMENHVPEIITALLLVVAGMTIAITGYSSGLNKARLAIPRFILILLTSLTLLVIIDLDRPRRGFIKVSEQGMVELQKQFFEEGAGK